MSISTEPFTCDFCVLRGSFGIAPADTPGLVGGQEVDASGLIHDPVYHADNCPGILARKGDVTCAYCRSDTPHLYHWYDHCTCAAGGAYEDHSSHCALSGVKLIFNDSLLVASRP